MKETFKKSLKCTGKAVLIIAALPFALIAALVWVIVTLCKMAAAKAGKKEAA